MAYIGTLIKIISQNIKVEVTLAQVFSFNINLTPISI